MTYRDPAPVVPDCPACGSADEVRTHENAAQGRWLSMCCMVLFSGTSAEWIRPERERQDITDEIRAARAALEEATDK